MNAAAIREELEREVAALPPEGLGRVLEYARWLRAVLSRPDAAVRLSSEQIESVREGGRQVARGEYIELDELLAKDS